MIVTGKKMAGVVFMENEFLTKTAPPLIKSRRGTTRQFNSAEEQLREAMNDLHNSLKYSTAMPNNAIRRWCDLLANPQTHTLSGLKKITKQIRADCERVSQTQLPYRSSGSGMHFVEQMSTIKNKLDWIIELVDHMIDHIQKHRPQFHPSTDY